MTFNRREQENLARWSAEDEDELKRLDAEYERLSKVDEKIKKIDVEADKDKAEAESQTVKEYNDGFKPLSPEEVDKLRELDKQLAIWDSQDKKVAEEKPSQGEAAWAGLQRGVSLGTSPAIAGVGAAIGTAIGYSDTEPEYRRGLWTEMKEAYGEGREERIAEEDAAAREHGGTFAVSQLGGNILTAPLTPISTFKGALALGGAYGVGESIGRAKDAGDVAENVLIGVAGGAAGHVVGKGLAKIGKAVKARTGNAVAREVKKKGGFVKDKIRSLQSFMTGLPKKDIEKYYNQTDKINKIIKKSGGDITEEVDLARGTIRRGIERTKNDLGKEIGKALKSYDEKNPIRIVPSDDPSVGFDVAGGFNIADIVGFFSKARARLHPKYHKNAIKALDDLEKTVREDAIDEVEKAYMAHFKANNPGKTLDDFDKQAMRKVLESMTFGNVSLETMHIMKQTVYDLIGKSGFAKDAMTFNFGKSEKKILNKGLKNIASTLKRRIDGSDETIKQANSVLHKMHTSKKFLPKKILEEGADDAGFLNIGRGGHRRNVKRLKKIEDTLDFEIKSASGEVKKFDPPNILDRASDVSAAQSFTSPSLLRKGSATNIIGQRLIGALGGAGLSSSAGYDPLYGAAIGAAASSPQGLKLWINAMNKVNNPFKGSIKGALKMLSNPKTRAVIIKEISAINAQMNDDEEKVNLNRIRKRLQKELKNSGKRGK